MLMIGFILFEFFILPSCKTFSLPFGLYTPAVELRIRNRVKKGNSQGLPHLQCAGLLFNSQTQYKS